MRRRSRDRPPPGNMAGQECCPRLCRQASEAAEDAARGGGGSWWGVEDQIPGSPLAGRTPPGAELAQVEQYSQSVTARLQAATVSLVRLCPQIFTAPGPCSDGQTASPGTSRGKATRSGSIRPTLRRWGEYPFFYISSFNPLFQERQLKNW